MPDNKWRQNNIGGPGKIGLGGTGIQSLNRVAERITDETATRKNNFKFELIKLFKSGQKPEDITTEKLSEILGIEKTSTKKSSLNDAVTNKLQTLFTSQVRRTGLLNFLYQTWLEDEKARTEDETVK